MLHAITNKPQGGYDQQQSNGGGYQQGGQSGY
jgi:hypothetical protein